MGKEPFAQMINSDERVDKNGNRSRLIPGVDYDPLRPFDFIGPIGFYERFDEVIDYFILIISKLYSQILFTRS